MLRSFMATLLVMIAGPSLSQDTNPVDGPNAVLADPLLDNLVGHWTAFADLTLSPG